MLNVWSRRMRAACTACFLLALPTAALAQPVDDDLGADEAIDDFGADEASDDGGLTSEPETPVEPAEAGTAAPITSAPGANAGYDGGFFIVSDDGRFQLVTQSRVQARYAFASTAAGDTREEETAFSLPRVRLTLKGHAFRKDIKYKFQTDFGKGDVNLKDFYVDYGVGNNFIRVGQWKRPFSRQQIASSGRLELIERAITDKAFGAGRDIGLAFHNSYEKSPEIEWVVGVFNGTGDKGAFAVEVDPMTGEVVDVGRTNVPAHLRPAVVARVGYNARGIKGYSEADLEGGPLRFGVGASVRADMDLDDDDADGAVLAEVDYIVKVNGISTTGGVYLANTGPGITDVSYSAIGMHLQGGYMLSEDMQVAARVALVSPDEGDSSQEYAIAHNLYPFGHDFKWQNEVALLVVDGSDLGDIVTFQSQLQLAF